ncbi:MAG: xanthine dehydrogenase family protein subunit M [Calditrichaeota bacterium]|nr:MAG: xanthine dehydrogenase family protein subunit M [Calditrichota bacterium]
MKPAPFKYFAPTSVAEVLSLLNQYGYDAKVLAGGQSLVPTMNFRLAQPEVLVDLNGVSDLFYLNESDQSLHFGAMVRQRHAERSALVAEHAPLIHEVMPHIAHPQIRNRGTIGGSLAHADPAAELPAVMVALDATFLLRSEKGERRLPAESFFLDLFTTALEPEEILAEVSVPYLPAKTGWAFREVARRHGDFALVGVAAVVTLDEKQCCRNARVVLISVGNGPVRATKAEQALAGQKLSASVIGEAAQIASEQDIDPPDDLHASSAYRRHLARVLTRQALTQARERINSRT